MSPTSVPLLDLHAQFRQVEADVRAAIDRVLASQHFILGPEVEAFEREAAVYSGCRHAVGLSSGTDAILVGLMAMGVAPGDEVVTTPYTFIATAGSIARLGARAVFVDIDPLTYALDAAKLDAAITPRTKAIMPVHLYGQMADMDGVLEVARARAVPVLEDAAQAIGAKRGGHVVGGSSIGATLSFFPSKNLGAMGDGGMIVTNDEAFAAKVRLLRNQGQAPKYFSVALGGNFRLDALQAAILRAKLPYLDGWTAARQANADRYRAAFAALGVTEAALALPRAVDGARHVYNQFVVRTMRRDSLMARLKERGVGCEVYYPQPMHLQQCFADWGYREGAFPEAEAAAKETVALPIFPELGEGRIELVAQLVAEALS